jgi:hypothetical protein
MPLPNSPDKKILAASPYIKLTITILRDEPDGVIDAFSDEQTA